MKVLVSACIMGENCKYNGKNNKNSAAIHFLKDKEVISICPEVLAGMETPRPCAEIVNGRVVDENGNDVSLEYNKAVAVALSKIQNEEIDLVILQSRSPTCGVNQIYDGTSASTMGVLSTEIRIFLSRNPTMLGMVSSMTMPQALSILRITSLACWGELNLSGILMLRPLDSITSMSL